MNWALTSSKLLQTVQSEAPRKEFVPFRQSLQVSIEIAPIALEYFPSTHAVQSADDLAPDIDEYLPETQLEHADAPEVAE